MSSSKKIDLHMDFAAGVYLSEAQNPIPPPPTLYTVHKALKGGPTFLGFFLYTTTIYKMELSDSRIIGKKNWDSRFLLSAVLQAARLVPVAAPSGVEAGRTA